MLLNVESKGEGQGQGQKEGQGQGQQDINKYLKQYYNIRINKKKSHGEVFTDISLVEKILDNLPGKVWTNSSFNPNVIFFRNRQQKYQCY